MFRCLLQTNHNMDWLEMYGKDNNLPTYFGKWDFCMNGERAMQHLGKSQ